MQSMQREDDEFAREALVPGKPTDPNRRRRAVRRALLAVGVCILLAITVLVATGTAGQVWVRTQFAWLQHNAPTITRATISPQPAGQRALPGDWQLQPQLTLPNPDVHWYISAPNDPNTYYGCSGLQTTADGKQQVGPLVFWYTHDAGQRWSSVRLPGTRVTYCNIARASDDSGRLLLQGQLFSGCTDVMAYVSADGGMNWQAIPTLPDAPPAPDHDCNISTWLSGRHLYLTYSYTTPSGTPQQQTSVEHWTFWRSDDGGQTWKRLDGNLPPEAENQFYPHLLNDGKTLLLQVEQYDPPTDGKPEHTSTWLWVSHDAGDNWQPLAVIDGLLVQTILPLADTHALADEHTLMPSTAHPLYLVNGASMPWFYYRIKIAQMTDLRHWAPLPPLPIPGADPEFTGIMNVLTTTASGRLLVFGLGPHDHISSDGSQTIDDQRPKQQWLWEWDPVASRWTLLTPTLDVPWPHCGDHCWNGWMQDSGEAGAHLWVVEYDANYDAEGACKMGCMKAFRIQYTP